MLYENTWIPLPTDFVKSTLNRADKRFVFPKKIKLPKTVYQGEYKLHLSQLHFRESEIKRVKANLSNHIEDTKKHQLGHQAEPVASAKQKREDLDDDKLTVNPRIAYPILAAALQILQSPDLYPEYSNLIYSTKQKGEKKYVVDKLAECIAQNRKSFNGLKLKKGSTIEVTSRRYADTIRKALIFAALDKD